MDLTRIATELYQELPANFTAARNARAKAAVAAGDRALADEIRRLPKPSIPVWALNRLAGADAHSVEDFGSLGTRLRAAQQRADRAELERLMIQRRSLVAVTLQSIQGLIHENDIQLSPAGVREIEQSLQAALADGDGANAVFSGRLVKPIQSDGLDPVDLSGAIAGPALRARARPRVENARPGARQPKVDAALITRTSKAAATADAAVEELHRRESEVQNDRDALDEDVESLQRQFTELEKRRAEVDTRDAEIQRRLRSAVAASREAHRAADEATSPG